MRENVLFPLLSTGRLGTREAEERALHYISKVNLIKFADHHPYALSGEIRQRMAVARGMAMEPDVLLIGEPSAALDALTCHRMQDESLQLWDETRFAVLFVTHSIPEAIRCDNRILVLSPHPGQVRAELPSLTRDDDDPERFRALETEIHGMLFVHIVEETHAD